MLAAKRSAGVTPEVNLREHVTCMPLPSANKAANSGFETQRRHHQKSKTAVSVATQKFFLKKSPLKSIANLFFLTFEMVKFLETYTVSNVKMNIFQIKVFKEINLLIINYNLIKFKVIFSLDKNALQLVH